MLWLLLQLLVFMLFLIAVGEPIRALFLQRLRFFADLDFLQVCLLDVYIGTLVLYIIAMLPLQLFSSSVILWLTVFGFLFSVLIHSRRFYRGEIGEIQTFLRERKTAMFDYVLILTMFLVFLWIQLIPLNTLVFGSVHDTSLHSLMVEVILENRYVPVTLQPYLPEGIVYPQASHVIFAYASCILNFEAPKAVFYVTPLFNSLSVFGAYFLGKKLWSDRRFYLGLSFVFAFVSSWPLYVTWGANPFIVGFPLFLICLGLFFSISRSDIKNDFKELIVVGILFGYSAAIIISYLEALLVIGVLWLAYECIRKSNHLGGMIKRFFLISCVSLLPLSPFIGRFIMFFQYPGHNIGIASGFTGYEKLQLKPTQALEWAFGNLSPHPILRVELIGLVVGFSVLLWKVRGNKNIKKVLHFAAAIFLSSTLLSFISYFLPGDVSVISWPHQSIILTIPISIFIVVFFLKLTQFFYSLDLKMLSKVFSKRSHAPFLISIMSLAAIGVPFIYYRCVIDPETLTGTYSLFAITTEDDYKLMQWMKDHLPKNSTVLVNPYEAGLFVPSTSHHKAVFPYVASQRAYGYQRLTTSLSQNILNVTTFELMQNYNITHIFIGTHVTYWWAGNYKWNARIFLGNPNFILLKNFGVSYLFELSYCDPKTVLLDEFDYENLTDMGWTLAGRGDGVGNAMVTSINGDNCLMLNSTNEASGDPNSLYFYEFQVSREVNLNDVSNITLSFYLNASSGFNKLDAVAVVISNIWSNRSIHFATPDGIFQLLDPNQTRTFTMNNFVGNFTFNLSESWSQAYNSNLPNTLLLQIRNFDIDSIPNVAFLDSLEISY